MEGGTRLGRASSRYGSTPQQQVFDGPVRKWKKQWVSNGGDGKRSNTPPLLLCRWTPLSATAAEDHEDQPPRRRFRYTPIVPIEKEKRESDEKARHEGKANMGNDNILGNPSLTQEVSEGQSDSNRSLDDDMDFISNRKNPNLDGEEDT